MAELVALRKLEAGERGAVMDAVAAFRQPDQAKAARALGPLTEWPTNRLASTLVLAVRGLLTSLAGDPRLDGHQHVDFLSEQAHEQSRNGISLDRSRAWAGLAAVIRPDGFLERLGSVQLVADLCALLAHLGDWAAGGSREADTRLAGWLAKIEAPVGVA